MYGPAPAVVPLPVPPVALPMPPLSIGTKMGGPPARVTSPDVDPAPSIFESSGSPPQPGRPESNTGRAIQLTSRVADTLRPECVVSFEEFRLRIVLGAPNKMGVHSSMSGRSRSDQAACHAPAW